MRKAVVTREWFAACRRLVAGADLYFLQSQRDCVLQPRVSELASLPWVEGQREPRTLKGFRQGIVRRTISY